MPRKHRFKVDKLIRDKLPEIMRSKGIEVFERVMETEEYVQRLKEKLLEEAAEVLSAKDAAEMREELADVLEVILSLCAHYGLTSEEIEAARVKKKAEKGGFEARIYNAYVEVDTDNRSIAYYLSRSQQYPEVK